MNLLKYLSAVAFTGIIAYFFVLLVLGIGWSFSYSCFCLRSLNERN
jgi:Na+/pantothenate symporter